MRGHVAVERKQAARPAMPARPAPPAWPVAQRAALPGMAPATAPAGNAIASYAESLASNQARTARAPLPPARVDTVQAKGLAARPPTGRYCGGASEIPGIAGSIGVVQRVGAKTLGASTLGAIGGVIGNWLMPGWGGTALGTMAGGLLGTLGGGLYQWATRKPDVHWKHYLNPQDFAKAGGEKNPGGYYDRDKSPGYQQSMVRAMREEVFGGGSGKQIDYEEYTRLHDLVTSHLRSRDSGMSSGTIEHIRTPSSVDEGTSFPINDWDRTATAPAHDLMEERILGMPMLFPFEDRDDDDQKGEKFELENARSKQPSVTAFHPGTRQIHVRYSQKQGQQIVEAILARYYKEVAEAGKLESAPKARDAKLTAIVKAIRALHVTHPFKDANGRLHAQLMLNRFLKEQGFGTTIMPEKEGLGAFGGAFSIEQLKTMVRDGFKTASELH